MSVNFRQHSVTPEEGESPENDNIMEQHNLSEGTRSTSSSEPQELSDYLQTLIQGKEVCGDSYSAMSKPAWLNETKFHRGQRFAMDHIYGVMYAELLSLMILFAFKAGLEPLIFTHKSDTPFKAFRRYLSTTVRVKTWYEGDIWNVDSLAHINLKYVRRMHDIVRRAKNSTSEEEVFKRVTLEGDESEHMLWTDLLDELQEDFQASCPDLECSQSPDRRVYINQCDMALTQFGFLGLILAFPKKFGIHNASEEDLEGFAHFWRAIGFLLGIEDKFNLCNGDLATVQGRCRDIVHYWAKPALRSVSRDWIHMSRCLMEGLSYFIPGMSLQVPLRYLCRVLDIRAERLTASMTYQQYFLYLWIVFLFWFVMRLPGMWNWHNWMINTAVMSAMHMSSERLRKLEQRVYPYESSDSSLRAFDLSG